MNIIFDTNIYHQNFRLDAHRYELVLEKAKRMNASILIPQIVYEELVENYRKLLESNIKNLEATRQKLNDMLGEGVLKEVSIDIDKEVAQYTSCKSQVSSLHA